MDAPGTDPDDERLRIARNLRSFAAAWSYMAAPVALVIPAALLIAFLEHLGGAPVDTRLLVKRVGCSVLWVAVVPVAWVAEWLVRRPLAQAESRPPSGTHPGAR